MTYKTSNSVVRYINKACSIETCIKEAERAMLVGLASGMFNTPVEEVTEGQMVEVSRLCFDGSYKSKEKE